MSTKKTEKTKLSAPELYDALIKATDLKDFFARHKESFIDEDLATYLNDLTNKMGLVREHVIKCADIDRSYGHQIFRGLRRPSRDKVIQLCFGMGLSEEETQKLLVVAGYSELFPCMRRDAVILYAIHKGMNLITAQALLDQEGFELLGKA